MKDHSWITDEMFDNELREVLISEVEKHGTPSLLSIPGVYEALSEHFNNAVLDGLSDARKMVLDEHGIEIKQGFDTDDSNDWYWRQDAKHYDHDGADCIGGPFETEEEAIRGAIEYCNIEL